MVEYFNVFKSSQNYGDSIMEVMFLSGIRKVPTVKFNWNDLHYIFEVGATNCLEQMTFDEHPYHVKSVQIDYEKKRVTINVGEPVDEY